jgi:hypothetical protein
MTLVLKKSSNFGENRLNLSKIEVIKLTPDADLMNRF